MCIFTEYSFFKTLMIVVSTQKSQCNISAMINKTIIVFKNDSLKAKLKQYAIKIVPITSNIAMSNIRQL